MQFSNEPRAHDHESDPAHTPGDGWVDEGGASHLGPATHLYSPNEEAAKPERTEEDEDPELGHS